jgi:hypothetical protein
MHGGYNNWIDGLSFAERLVHRNDRVCDWWFVDGMSSNTYLQIVSYNILTNSTVSMLLLKYSMAICILIVP